MTTYQAELLISTYQSPPLTLALLVPELKVLGTTHRPERSCDIVTTSGWQNGYAKRLQEARELQARSGQDVNVKEDYLLTSNKPVPIRIQ